MIKISSPELECRGQDGERRFSVEFRQITQQETVQRGQDASLPSSCG
ncbi:hypothetical protein TIFTF001_008431 [Ficus carica]|uniref:Uncharacterized protein n=1 Tax=Ficus carica TaxID=3494 RepID=A0AA88AF22_FICCA|nr:hypothetical protein TIFTF001_008431 [Ficus carica]